MTKKLYFFLSCAFLALVVVGCQPSKKKASTPAAPDTRNFMKLDAAGKALAKQDADYKANGTPDQGTAWSCVQQKDKKLIWEVKSDSTNETVVPSRNYTLGYNWYQTTNNKGEPGTKSTKACTYAAAKADLKSCDTQSYIDALNAAKLCGSSKWRLPAAKELGDLMVSAANPQIDIKFFPNTAVDAYWTSETWSTPKGNATEDAKYAKVLLFGQGISARSEKSSFEAVRAVADE